MEFHQYLPVFIQIALALAMAGAILAASHLFGQRSISNPIKDSPYECGMVPVGGPHPRFAVKFYITAMLFILFDIEIVFLLPGILVYREFIANAIPIIFPMLFFISILLVGLIYEIKKGALEWQH